MADRHEEQTAALGKAKVTKHLRAALADILACRPANPLDHLANYFDGVVNGVTPVKTAYQMLTVMHYSRKGFEDRLCGAFTLLAGETATSTSAVSLPGVRGSVYTQVLGMLASEFSPQASDALMKRFQRRPYELVTYAVFRTAVLACLMYKDCISQARQLFVDLEVASAPNQPGAGVPKSLCESLIEQLISPASAKLAHVEAEMQLLLAGSAGNVDKGGAERVALPEFLRSASTVFLQMLVHQP
eukprot:m.152152 g.152152  ORF g.152152 m.152152 type:complete len:244 (-) comp17433_c0_seq3:138-869(-)